MAQWSVRVSSRGADHKFGDPDIDEASYGLDHTEELGRKIADIHDSHNGNTAFVKEHPDYPHKREAVTRGLYNSQKTLHLTTPEGHALTEDEVRDMMAGGDSGKIREGAAERVKRNKQSNFEHDTRAAMSNITDPELPSPIHPDVAKAFQYYDGGSVTPTDSEGNSDGTVTYGAHGWYQRPRTHLPDVDSLKRNMDESPAPASRNQSFQEGPTGEYTAYQAPEQS